MGTTTDAHCFACGYDTGLTIGGTMATYLEVSWWPVHCPHCREITDANVRKERLSCRVCGSEDVVDLSDLRANAGAGEDTVVRCFDRELTDGHYKCPACGKFELRFGTNASGKHDRILFD